MSIKDPSKIGHRALLQQVLQLTELLDFPMQMTPRKITILLFKESFTLPYPHPLAPSLSPLLGVQKHCARITASHAYRH